jgi:hypothetical protein
MSFVAAPLAGSSTRAGIARVRPDVRTIATAVPSVAVCTLILLAPFEAREPLLVLPGQSLSTVEAALLLAVGASTLSLFWRRTRPTWRTPLGVPWTTLVLSMGVAAVAAPAHRGNALAMVGRLALAFVVYLLVVNGAPGRLRLRSVLVATGAAGVAVATFAVLEYLSVDRVLTFLAAFRPWVTLVGAQVRASGPLPYPTIASMFLEIAFAFVLGLMVLAVQGRRYLLAALALAAAVTILQGIIVTFTRAGLITATSTLAIVGWLTYRRSRFDKGAAAVAAVAAIFVGQVLVSRSFEELRLRLTTETMEAWYRAEVSAPRELSFATGSRTPVAIQLRNAGGATWDSTTAQPFRFSYHWLMADEDVVVSWEGLRTPLPAQVAPGTRLALTAIVEAPPEPGDYRLMWDVEQTHRLWFSTEPDAPIYVTRVSVTGPAVPTAQRLTRSPLPTTAVRPGRLTLWRAAGTLVADRPLLGVGPDNYRLIYGEPAGLANFDRRVHSNNMYIEMLVGGGIVGALAFGWLCWAAGAQIVALVRDEKDTNAGPVVAALAAATAAIGLHGLVDSFWSFTATYILIAVTLGLTSAALTCSRTHAHRV